MENKDNQENEENKKNELNDDEYNKHILNYLSGKSMGDLKYLLKEFCNIQKYPAKFILIPGYSAFPANITFFTLIKL